MTLRTAASGMTLLVELRQGLSRQVQGEPALVELAPEFGYLAILRVDEELDFRFRGALRVRRCGLFNPESVTEIHAIDRTITTSRMTMRPGAAASVRDDAAGHDRRSNHAWRVCF